MNISNEIIAVLSGAHIEGNMLFLNGQLDRNLYNRTNKVLEAAGGTWNRKAKAHVFVCDAEQRIDEIILSGTIVIPKDDFNFFPTPPKIVSTMVQWANITDGERVLEPQCGDGRIVVAIAEAANAKITAIELDAIRVQALKTNSRFTGTGVELVQGDFLRYQQDDKFDVILMNPPFRNKADIKHTSHAMDMLNSGGRLCGILSAGVLYREDALTVAFRRRVASMGGSLDLLEDKAFKESGTLVKTVMLKIKL